MVYSALDVTHVPVKLWFQYYSILVLVLVLVLFKHVTRYQTQADTA